MRVLAVLAEDGAECGGAAAGVALAGPAADLSLQHCIGRVK